MHRILILIILSYVAAAWTQTSPPPTATENAIASVRASIEAVRQKQQAMPEPRTDSERLIRMGELEQAPRTAMSTLNAAEVDRAAVLEAVAPLLRQIDEANKQQLLAMVPEEGWFSISRYGREAAMAAFLIVQHSDQQLWRRFLPKIEAMARTGEAEGPAYALMYDRLALSEGRPQRYGSQMRCQDGRYVTIEPIEHMKTIDERRAALRMSPYAQYLAIYAPMRC